MKDIGIRDLKAHASALVRQVSENHATYTITRRGHAVGVLAPPGFVAPAAGAATAQAWDRLTQLADKLDQGGPRHRSAVRMLEQTRR